MTAWDRTAIVLLGSAGFAFSYDALRQIAVAIHARESLSYLFPVFVDGFIAYGVRAIVLLRNRHFGARLYAWVLFLAATGASLGANALHAITLNHGPQAGRSALHLSNSVVGVLSTLAPLALAGSVHLYILMARTAEHTVRDEANHGPGPVRGNVRPEHDDAPWTTAVRPVPELQAPEAQGDGSGPSAPDGPTGTLVDLHKHGLPPADTAHLAPDEMPGPAQSPVSADGPGEATDEPDGQLRHVADQESATPSSTVTHHPAPPPVRDSTDGKTPPVPDGVESPQDRKAKDSWLDDIMPIARAAASQAGRISRDALKDHIRAHTELGNDRMGVVLALLKEEEKAAAKEAAAASSASQ
ncbi:DUF2637 domain-containing protein [Streptomyces sp. NPDC008086]|uniref:DUF2637 domain-containing protein n=1 Tax=Streptomyces sp. NPDC008086 TaxID=3364807 RepID=UPI0036EAE54C